MEENEGLMEIENGGYDDSAHQACYIFNPVGEDELAEIRPTKRRKLKASKSNLDSVFPTLLNGEEDEYSAHLRHELFKRSWAGKEAKINQTLNEVDREVVTRFKAFIETSGNTSTTKKLPTGILVSGSDSNAHHRLLSAWKDQLDDPGAQILVQLQPSHCPNLQTFLKNVIKLSITAGAGIDAYNDHLNKHKQLIPMNFDLELLQEFAQDKKISNIVISILDGETFDTGMMMEMLSTLHSWIDRIPFVLIIGLATTVELFESRLANFTVKHLDVQVFDLSSTSSDPMYRTLDICQTDEDTSLFLGPSVINSLFEMTQNQGSTVESFTRAIKYIYMSHFFSNPLSILLSKDLDISKATKKLHLLCDAIRNTDTFHALCDELLNNTLCFELFDEEKEEFGARVRKLLNDDKHLLDVFLPAMATGQRDYLQMCSLIAAHTDLRHCLEPYPLRAEPPIPPVNSRFETLVKLHQCYTSHEELQLYHDEIYPMTFHLRSQDLLTVLESLSEKTRKFMNLSSTMSKLRAFQAKLPNSRPSVMSKYDFDIPRTAIENTIVTYPGSGAKLDKLEKQYTSILDTLLSELDSKLKFHCPFSSVVHEDNMTDASAMLLSEAYIFDLRQPLHASLIFPRPRHAIERALSRPGDYLSCGHETCGGGGDKYSSTSTAGILQNEASQPPPPTSVLYNLLQEAPTIINVRDLFDAFCTRIRRNTTTATATDENDKGQNDLGEEEEDEDNNDDNEEHKSKSMNTDMDMDRDRLTMTLFYRSLAELKYLGLVKASASTGVKKKVLKQQQQSSSALEIRGGAEMKMGIGDVDFIAKTSWFGL